MFVFNLLVGGVIGGFVLAWRLFDGSLLSGENGFRLDLKAYEQSQCEFN